MSEQKLLPGSTAPRVGEVVYEVDKKCPLCGKEWKGKGFRPNPDANPLVRECDECIVQEEADFKKRTNMRNESEQAPEADLIRPKRVGD